MAHLAVSTRVDESIQVAEIKPVEGGEWSAVLYIGTAHQALYLSADEARVVATKLLDIVGWGQPDGDTDWGSRPLCRRERAEGDRTRGAGQR